MTRAARQKAERLSTADYAASQQLFDSFRIGFIKVNDQRAELSIARDIAQHLDGLPSKDDETTLADKRRRAINCAVKAWRSATEIYADIFHALAEATKAHTSESEEQTQLQAKFGEIATNVKQANTTANSFELFGVLEDTRSYAKSESAKARSVDDEDDSSNSSPSATDDEEGDEPVDSTPTNETLLHLLGQGPRPQQVKGKDGQPLVSRSNGKISYDSKGGKILWHKGVEKPYVPYGTLGGSQKKEWQAEKRRQKREKKAAKRATKRATTQANKATAPQVEDTSRPTHDRDYISLNGTAEPRSAATSASYIVPRVEYEDVSAEVEARLKAKEAKKEAAKKEKKRKRESGDSLPSDVNGMAEKPDKKKVKAVVAEDNGGSTQKHGRSDAEPTEGEARKKRKKAKS